jgi:hypothetical protein
MALSNRERQARWRKRAQQALTLDSQILQVEKGARTQTPGIRHLQAWWLSSKLDTAFRNMPEAERVAFHRTISAWLDRWPEAFRHPPRPLAIGVHRTIVLQTVVLCL